MLYCSFCGKKIYDKSSFCSSCGQKVIRIEELDMSATEAPASEQVVVEVDITEPSKLETPPIIGEHTAREADGPKKTKQPGEVSIARPPKKVIPAILLKDKGHEKYIIDVDGKRIEIVADFGKKPKVDLFVEGEPPETIDKQDSEVTFEFEGLTNKHKIGIWFSLAPSSTFNVNYKEAGVSITIDGVPVKNSLADPLVGIKGGSTGLILFAVALGIKGISSIVQSINVPLGDG